jgi:hypothetical protein
MNKQTLNDKIVQVEDYKTIGIKEGEITRAELVIRVEDVKEFIKELKEELLNNIPLSATPYTKECCENIIKEIIDKLAGDKLLEEKEK